MGAHVEDAPERGGSAFQAVDDSVGNDNGGGAYVVANGTHRSQEGVSVHSSVAETCVMDAAERIHGTPPRHTTASLTQDPSSREGSVVSRGAISSPPVPM